VIHLSRDLWQPIDLACGICFVLVGLLVGKRSPEQDRE
jgi:hypothetical protein